MYFILNLKGKCSHGTLSKHEDEFFFFLLLFAIILFNLEDACIIHLINMDAHIHIIKITGEKKKKNQAFIFHIISLKRKVNIAV